MSFLEGLLITLSLVSGFCYAIATIAFPFTKKISRKKYRLFIFVSVFLCVFFFFILIFFGDDPIKDDLTAYVFFIVTTLIFSVGAGGFMVLGDIYHEKLTGFSQSKLQKVIQKQAVKEAEEREEGDEDEEK